MIFFFLVFGFFFLVEYGDKPASTYVTFSSSTSSHAAPLVRNSHSKTSAPFVPCVPKGLGQLILWEV